MPSKQGDVGLLRDPVAQQLLQVKGPAHLAYNWRDGTPRVIPMGFHWNGQEIVMASEADAPKTKVLTTGSKVAVSIASTSLYVRRARENSLARRSRSCCANQVLRTGSTSSLR